MTSNIKNYGIIETQILNGNKKLNNKIKWDADYNGKIVDLNISVNDNGNKQNLHTQLDNDDILDLLGEPSVNIPIEDRLLMDFPLIKETSRSQFDPIILENLLSKSIKKKTRDKKYKTSNNRKNKKTKRTYNLKKKLSQYAY